MIVEHNNKEVEIQEYFEYYYNGKVWGTTGNTMVYETVDDKDEMNIETTRPFAYAIYYGFNYFFMEDGKFNFFKVEPFWEADELWEPV